MPGDRRRSRHRSPPPPPRLTVATAAAAPASDVATASGGAAAPLSILTWTRRPRCTRAPSCSRAWRLALGHPSTHRAAARRLRLRGAPGACGRTPPALGVHATGAALLLQQPQHILRRHRDDRCRGGRHDSLRLCSVQAVVREARGRQRRRRARWTATVMVLTGARRAAAAG